MMDRKRDLRSELEKVDREDPENWYPDVGDILVGEVLRYTSGHTASDQYPICVVRDEENGGQLNVWVMHSVLRNKFKEKRPKPGERIGIKRLPDAPKGYKRFALLVDRDHPEVLHSDALERPGNGRGQDCGEFSSDERDDSPFYK